MTNEEAAELILKAAGSGLRHYMPASKEKILKAVETVRKESYVAGAHSAWDVIKSTKV